MNAIYCVMFFCVFVSGVRAFVNSLFEMFVEFDCLLDDVHFYIFRWELIIILWFFHGLSQLQKCEENFFSQIQREGEREKYVNNLKL